VELNYEQARRLEGELVRFKKDNGEVAVGRVLKVRKDGMEITELNSSSKSDGYGYGFWGSCCFIPFNCFLGCFPFLWW
jgi:hypothetical protein